MKSKALQYLQKNFTIALGILSGFSVFYFLYFLDAFSIQKGISYSGHSHLFRSASFGFMTFSYLLLFEVWIKERFNLSNTKRIALWYLTLVVLGSQLTFVLFNFFWNFQEWDWMGYLLIQKEYPLMMVFPFTVYLLLQQAMKKGDEKDTYLLFYSENQKDRLKLKLEDFLFAQSAENYITIHYKNRESIKQHLIRKTLKNLEQELSSFSDIKRSHRSYLVNAKNISNIIQKKDKTSLEIASYSLPVSKKREALFLS
ncbi:MAG: hypothetical protein CMB99_02025 [Flavobacteriaceae bacterium]|nr:hypothetical protein [Flavobacteriaceae bacterium]|tara:strand:- start:49627 stop:50394 length:768 start_codon:yes stop_codon:yes gene_type:complete